MNHKIRAPQIRLLDAAGNMVGVVSISEAMVKAREAGLDLVEISANAEPPVCRLMDYGKFKYEQSRKERESRRKQHSADMKEMKFHANVGDHDYQTKVNHIRDFLAKGQKVKVSLYFRGRENAHREIGFEVINRVLKDCESVCHVDMTPKLIGNSIVTILGGRAPRHSAPAAPASAPRPGPGSGLPIPAVPVEAAAAAETAGQPAGESV